MDSVHSRDRPGNSLGRLRCDVCAYRCLDLLAWDNPAYALEQITGGDRCAVGKAWIASSRFSREYAAKSKEAEFLFRFDAVSGTGHLARSNGARRTGVVQTQLQPLSRFLERDDDLGSLRCNRANGRSRCGTQGGFRKVLTKTTVASRHLGRVNDVSVFVDADFLKHSTNAALLGYVPHFA